MTSEKPFLSIIVPAFNAGKTLNRCIESISKHKDIEIIVIDDGSTDNTKKICTYYCGCDERIKYFFQENQGPGAARNSGIRKSQGKYIMFLDSDDYLDGKALMEILENELKQNHDIVYYNFEQVYENGDIIKFFKLDEFNRYSNKDLISYTLSWKLPWGQFKIIKKELIDSLKLKFTEHSNDSEELVFTVSILEGAKSIFFSHKSVYKYVKNNSSLSTTHRAIDLYNIRSKIIRDLTMAYGETYPIGVNNYSFASHLQVLKLFAEQYKGLQGFLLYKEYLHNDMKKWAQSINVNYYSLRYKVLYRLFKAKLSIIIFLIFKVRGDYHSKRLNKTV